GHEKAFYTDLTKFIKDSKPLVNSARNINCPCKSCRTILWVSIENLLKRITRYGWDPGYKTWVLHGELDLPLPTPVIDNTRQTQMSDMIALLNDLSYIPLNNDQNETTQGDIGETSNELTQSKNNEFKELYASANEELYPGCDYVTRLDFMEKFTYFKVKGIASVEIINRQLPFKYTITRRSTDVVLISLASPIDAEYLCSVMRYMIHNEVACLILRIGELHAMLIEYENGLPKKAKTPQVMMIKGGKIQKAKKKSLIAKGMDKASDKGKDKQVYISKPKYPKTYAKEHPAKYDACYHCKEDYALESATRILNMVPTKKGCEALVKQDTLEKLQQRSVKCIFIGYPKETMEVSGRAIDLEKIQDEDTSSFEITSKIPMEVEGFEPPQEEVILVRRSERTHRAPTHLCLNVEVEEHSLGDLNEPAS
nr:hypothetical protein [Tanacetum cinerariifolium]